MVDIYEAVVRDSTMCWVGGPWVELSNLGLLTFLAPDSTAAI